jgi:hypothetical protein
VGAAGSLAIGSTPASASYPATPFGTYSSPAGAGYTWGGIIWYNRSVGVQGEVVDYLGGLPYTQVQFRFRHYNVLIAVETRTAESEARPFNWTEPGPVGGITAVDIDVCDVQLGCVRWATIGRP